ncbi:DNA repair protein RadC [Phaeovibrio sulfidiphilus]|uniref:DNA repair protein RadC n=1 Tax=Phaeovibrio sulfidiphilus TaxID=1220600 RepID=A0A8J6YR82_9PROT|nr:DNA repair protein RadC [Phaeovibrio sulfidiphilus]MBE1237942.1 DNA repair protein RadC [Phaeovibrio sulfidiphilus]
MTNRENETPGPTEPELFPSGKPARAPRANAASGHRSRLRERFLTEPDSLPDYELLELILFQAQPRVDTKPLARRLLAEFGDFARIISAGRSELERIEGMGPAGVAALKAVEAGAHRLLRTKVMDRPLLATWDSVLEYLHAKLAHQTVEHFRLLFLDTRNRLIADELSQRGTLNQSSVYPREVVKRALDLHAAAVIMVHNHPSGDPTPSASDQDVSLKVRDALNGVGIRLHDHLVIGRQGHVSLKAMGLF